MKPPQLHNSDSKHCIIFFIWIRRLNGAANTSLPVKRQAPPVHQLYRVDLWYLPNSNVVQLNYTPLSVKLESGCVARWERSRPDQIDSLTPSPRRIS